VNIARELILTAVILASQTVHAQTITEKIQREAPRLSATMGVTYDSNLQESETYEHAAGVLVRGIARYRLNDDYLLSASTGLTQRMTQENRTDMINTTITLAHTPFAIGTLGDMRPLVSLVLPTNGIQRDKESLRGALRAGAAFYVKTNSNFIMETGASVTLNNHQYSRSAFDVANIQWRGSPYIIVGWSFGDHWQVTAYNGLEATRTYNGTDREFFELDQSITYIANRKWNVTLGHNNAGSVTTLDGRGSNVAFFDSRTSTVYLNGNFNF